MDISDQVVEAFGNKIVPTRKPVHHLHLTQDHTWIAVFDDGNQSYLGNYGKPTPMDVNRVAEALRLTVIH